TEYRAGSTESLYPIGPPDVASRLGDVLVHHDVGGRRYVKGRQMRERLAQFIVCRPRIEQAADQPDSFVVASSFHRRNRWEGGWGVPVQETPPSRQARLRARRSARS